MFKIKIIKLHTVQHCCTGKRTDENADHPVPSTISTVTQVSTSSTEEHRVTQSSPGGLRLVRPGRIFNRGFGFLGHLFGLVWGAREGLVKGCSLGPISLSLRWLLARG